MPDLNIPSGGVYGQTKWLPGSLGADIFLPQGSAITAGSPLRVLETQGGTGLQGGAEAIVQSLTTGLTYRLRHIMAQVQVGQTLQPGQTIGVVSDPSLNLLGAIPLQTPSGWQHLDLSVNQGSTQFNPQGGGGGNVSTASWLQSIGYQGSVVQQTPGPNNANGQGYSGGSPAGFLGQLGGLLGNGLGQLQGGETAPGGGFGGGGGITTAPVDALGGALGGLGKQLADALGAGAADFWKRSGATIGVLLLGVGLVGVALLRTDTGQAIVAGGARAAVL
jgi:hypothetical protein